jgi:hypothetical protein
MWPSMMISNENLANGNGQQRLEMIGRSWKWLPEDWSK